MTLDMGEIIKDFQKAARKTMRRMARDDGFACLMYGTDVYNELLTAYAKSLGKKPLLEPQGIPPSLVDVKTMWDTLHKE